MPTPSKLHPLCALDDPRPTRHDPPPTTHDPPSTTHDPRPTPTTHDPRPHPHAHEHAHQPTTRDPLLHRPPGLIAAVSSGPFPHDRLDAYQVALQLAALANRIATQIPRGHRNIADHLLRAASNTALLLGEGANRRGAAAKRQRFAESRGECGEVAAAADLLRAMGIGSDVDVAELKLLASRVSAMLTRLIARLS